MLSAARAGLIDLSANSADALANHRARISASVQGIGKI